MKQVLMNFIFYIVMQYFCNSTVYKVFPWFPLFFIPQATESLSYMFQIPVQVPIAVYEESNYVDLIPLTALFVNQSDRLQAHSV